MKLIVVERRGIYGQGIGGVFSSQKIADQAIEILRKRERDDYHTFSSEEMELDVIQEL